MPARLNILVAEDNNVNQKLMKRVLEKAGHQVSVAGNGREALKLLEESEHFKPAAERNHPQFDAILMDIQMPELNGIETTGEIRRRESAGGTHIPIVALTAHALNGAREEYAAAGMDDYVVKPVDTDALFRILGRLTAGNQMMAPELLAIESERSERYREKLLQRVDGKADLLMEIVHELFLKMRDELGLERQLEEQRIPLDEIIDLPDLIRRLEGDLPLFAELIEAYFHACPPLLESILHAEQRGDLKSVAEAAHNLRGMLANLSTRRALLVASDLCLAAESGDGTRARATAACLIQELDYLTPLFKSVARSGAILTEQVSNIEV